MTTANRYTLAPESVERFEFFRLSRHYLDWAAPGDSVFTAHQQERRECRRGMMDSFGVRSGRFSAGEGSQAKRMERAIARIQEMNRQKRAIAQQQGGQAP